MIFKKLRSRMGMTMVEALIALAIFAILSVALVVGTTAAWKVYQRSVVASEARTLQSTLSQSLVNEFHYARNIRQQGGKVVFDSENFGFGVSVLPSTEGKNGIIQIGTETKNFDLLPEKAYTNDLKAEATVSYADGFFTVELTISHELLPGGCRTTGFTVRALNSSADVTSTS